MVDHDGKSYSEARPNYVHVDKKCNAISFCRVFFHNYAVILSRFIPSQLLVYSSKEAFDNGEIEGPLNSFSPIHVLGKIEGEALIVMVPSVLEDASNKKMSREKDIRDVQAQLIEWMKIADNRSLDAANVNIKTPLQLFGTSFKYGIFIREE